MCVVGETGVRERNMRTEKSDSGLHWPLQGILFYRICEYTTFTSTYILFYIICQYTAFTSTYIIGTNRVDKTV